MFPYLIDLGTVELPLFGPVDLYLPTYGVLFALGVVLAWWWFTRRARSLGVPDDQAFNLSFWVLLAGLAGAKLLLVFLDLRFYLTHPAELWGSLRSAGVLGGGVLGGAIVFVLYCRRHDLPVLRLGDAIAAPLALSQALGRLGCFAAGCCWGVECSRDHPLAVVFTDPRATAHTGVPLNTPLLSIQLVQMFHDLVLAAVLTVLWRRKVRPAGTVFWVYLLLYGIGRGVIEFWRGDLSRGMFLDGRLSTSQILSVGAVVLAVVLLVRGRLRGGATEAA